jgi:ligand-binding sensor domain-containing protein
MWALAKDEKMNFWLHWAVRKSAINNFLLLIALLLGSVAAQAQGTIRFKNYTVKEGLSMGTITAFTEDYQGFMWIATAEGLHRFDGKNFKIYKHVEGGINSLTDSYITTLLAVGKKIYIGNHSGVIDVLDLDSYTFSAIKPSEIESDFDFPIVKLAKFKNTILASTAGGGIWTINLKTQMPLKLNLSGRSGNEMLFSADLNSFFLIDRDTIFKATTTSAIPLFSSNQKQLTAIKKYNDGYLIGSTNGLFFAQDNFKKLEEITLPPKRRRISHITEIAVTGDDIWVGTMGGLLSIRNADITHYYADDVRPYSLINNQITSIFISKDNILWAGTIGGVSIYAPQLQKFGLLHHFEFNNKTYNNNVYFVYEDKQNAIWIGTLSSGLIKLTANNEIDKIYETVGSGDYESKAVRCLFQDSKNRFWVGTRDAGLFLFDEKKEQFTLVANKANGKLGSNVIRSIFEDSENNIWIGAQDGLYFLDPIANKFVHYQAETLSINNSVYQITENPTTGNLILASFRGGLQFFDRMSRTFEALKYKEFDSNSLSNNNVMSLSWVNSDTLLVGTYGGGLNIYSFISKSFTHITEEDGLVNNAVYGITYEGNGVCWLSTNDGLVRYDFHKQNFKNFKPEHYLQSTEFNEGAFLKSSNGIMYFGGVSGLNYFNPKSIPLEKRALPLFITDVRGKYKTDKPDFFELNYIDSRLELDFVAPNYSNPDGLVYEYKLEGFDKDWIMANGNSAIYPQLNPGSYTFIARVKDEFGIWQSVSEPIAIVVQPPFWKQWWFITLCALVIGSIVYAFFRFRTREISRSYKMQLVDSELNALRSQMNPHFIFNSLNSIQYYILKKEPREAYTYLSKFASLMRKILQNSRLKHITVADEVEWLNLYLELEKLRMDNELTYEIATVGITDTSEVSMPTMLLQPFVENSIVHGLLAKEKDRNISIIIEKGAGHLECTITDNGIGRVASAKMNELRSSKHKSTGMDLTIKRLDILSEGKGKYAVEVEDLYENNEPSGTCVRLIIPIITEI